MSTFAGGARTIPAKVTAGAKNPQAFYDDLVVADLPTGFWLLDDYTSTDAQPDNSPFAAKVGPALRNFVFGNAPGAANSEPMYPGYYKKYSLSNILDVDTFAARVGLNSNAALDAITDNITVEAWALVHTWSDVGGVVNRDNGGGNGLWNLTFVHVGGWIQFSTNHDTEVVKTLVEPALDTWWHLVGTRKRNDFCRFYVNGVSVGTPVATADVAMTPSGAAVNGIGIGNTCAGTQTVSHPLLGYVSRVAVYNYALTAAQVLAHYNASKTV